MRPFCSRCINRNVTCVYATTDDHRGTVPKSYARHLEARVAFLEDILRLHDIDVDKAPAYHLERHPRSLTDKTSTPAASSTEGDKNCTQGTLRFDEPCNYPDYPEGRFFGVTSDRADLHWPDDRAHQISDNLCYDQQPELDERNSREFTICITKRASHRLLF